MTSVPDSWTVGNALPEAVAASARTKPLAWAGSSLLASAADWLLCAIWARSILEANLASRSETGFGLPEGSISLEVVIGGLLKAYESTLAR